MSMSLTLTPSTMIERMCKLKKALHGLNWSPCTCLQGLIEFRDVLSPEAVLIYINILCW